MMPQLAEAALMLRLADRDITALQPCAVLLRYDDTEVEIANVSRPELAQMVAVLRAWAESVFRAARDAEARS